MSLLDQANALPSYTGTQARRRWADYVAPYFALVSKGYPKTEACRTLGELAKLTEDETTLLHRASKGWKNPTA